MKFIRRLSDRPRRSDRSIMFRAVLAALAAHLVFWSVFSYRRSVSPMRSQGSSISLLNSSELTPELLRWLDDHDPANMIRSDYRGGYAAQLPPEPPRPGISASHSVAPRPAPAPKVRAFRVLAVAPAAPGVRFPGMASPPFAASAKRAAVTDELGRALPYADVKLPFRTAKVQGDTVLRMLNIGGLPVLAVESSCGDPELDRAATAIPVAGLAKSEPPPQFIVVRWPEIPADKEAKP